MTPNFIVAENIVKRFSGHTALDGVNITIPRGKVFGLLGPNGAGKTTFIRIVNHITLPDEGYVEFDGHPLQASDMLSIGYLPEERGLYKKMKVGEQAVYLARLKGLTEKEARKRLTEWFEKLGIMPWWNRKLEELSKGMQQKVQFVTTVLHEPPLLIFDEPFSGFDPVNAEILKKEILELKEKGHTILFSTHNMASAEELCDEIALIDHSKVVLQGKIDEVRNSHKSGACQIELPLGTNLDDLCMKILSQTTLKDRIQLTIQRDKDETNSALLTRVAQKAEILSFYECLPSLNEIFINTVTSSANHE